MENQYVFHMGNKSEIIILGEKKKKTAVLH